MKSKFLIFFLKYLISINIFLSINFVYVILLSKLGGTMNRYTDVDVDDVGQNEIQVKII